MDREEFETYLNANSRAVAFGLKSIFKTGFKRHSEP